MPDDLNTNHKITSEFKNIAPVKMIQKINIFVVLQNQ